MKNKKIKKIELKTLCFILIATLMAPTGLVFAEENRIFGTGSLFETEGEIIKNITPEWFDNQAPWTTPKVKFLGENFVASGAKVYRYGTENPENLAWKEVTPKWEGSFIKKITALQVYNGKLYLGTYSRGWAEVWESSDGNTWKNITPVEKRDLIYTDPEGNEVQIVGAPDFEVLPTMWGGSYFEVSFLEEFGGYLYVGLASGTGAEIFRYSNSAVGGKTIGWERANPNWSTQNVNVKAAEVFNDELLIGTYNLSGAQLWKLSLDGMWSQISFGGAGGIRINDLEVFGDTLYIGLLDGNGRSEIIRIVGTGGVASGSAGGTGGDFADNSTIITPKKWDEFSQFEVISLEAVGNSLFAEILVGFGESGGSGDGDKIEIWELKDNIWYKFADERVFAEEVANESDETEETGETSTSESHADKTPPEILIAVENIFQEIKDFVAALGLSVNEETQTLIAESNFTVLGDTTLSDVTVTGDLRVGFMELDSVENSIGIVGPSCYSEITGEIIDEELCGAQALKLQAGRAGNVDVFDGKIILSPDGSVRVAGSVFAETVEAGLVRAKKYEVETVDGGVAGASAGRAVILGGETVARVGVGAGVLTEDSMIMVTPEIPVAVGSKRVDVDGEDNAVSDNIFAISLAEPLEEDLNVSWWIVN